MNSNKQKEPFTTLEEMEEHLAWEKCCQLSLEILCKNTKNTSKTKESDGKCRKAIIKNP